MKTAAYPAWLEEAIIYQIFPASYCDSDGDGMGDLNGIASKLDYLRSLGINTIWLSPIYDSPFRDAGYDVRDFCEVAKRYGTMEDFENLVEAVHARGMRLLLDFVPGHTSSEHPWFERSCEVGKNAYSDWYVWTDRTFYTEFDFPGQFVIGHAPRNGNYLANFFYFQPALNYGFAAPDPRQPWQLSTDHPSVRALRAEMSRIMRFWLDKGVNGFRVDMASSLIKGVDKQAVQAAMVSFWADIRTWWDVEYPDALLLAEWSNPSAAIHCGFHLDFMIHFDEANGMKAFRGEDELTILPRGGVSYFNRAGHGSLDSFWKEFAGHRSSIESKGLCSIPSGNHDLPRYSLGRTEEDLKIINTFLLTLPHVPTIYYGDEIGMRHLDGLPSKEGAYDRTGARTPMQWDATANAGFSSAAAERLYLPIDPDQDRPTVESQASNSDSVFNHLKALLRLRRENLALGASGSLTLLDIGSGAYPLLFLRESARDTFLIVLNPLERNFSLELPIDGSPGSVLIGNARFTAREGGRSWRCEIPSLSASIVRWARGRVD